MDDMTKPRLLPTVASWFAVFMGGVLTGQSLCLAVDQKNWTIPAVLIPLGLVPVGIGITAVLIQRRDL